MTVSDEKRKRIREKIAASQERLEKEALAERQSDTDYGAKARELGNDAKGFAKQHPVLTVAGGLAAGVLIAALLKPKTARALGKRALSWGALAAEGALLYGNRALDSAGEAGAEAKDRIGEFGGTVSDGASDLAREAERIGQAALENARETTRALFAKVRR
ncbi:MAG: hypothetical protein COW16_03335 [Sphingomonadales bacterium CG12_big_fil_rev_8_21_14_0_65_65_10]|jgi:ElaB/YqjD/DUF883 family membrane-anchored ribosome-binding protein|nr:MAG: hypothetical protein COW16_03335 [Sphingomonadales bacterium CG12_big_fil_rev_8_21_14_0_65_65_10]